MLDRKEIISRAYTACMTEMYAKAQPPADYNQLIQDVKDGKIDKNEMIYERHYLSHEEFKYILNKYIEAYGLKEKWNPYVETVEQYLIEGGIKDKYIQSYTDKHGNYHTAHRGYENVKPIKEQIEKILNDEFTSCEVSPFVKDALRDKIVEIVMNTIKDCKDFYRFDREESQFSASVALGPSPCSNKDTVIEYWKSQGVDIEIEERNPLLLWEQDYYGENFEEIMEDEYGENWREYFEKKWKEEKEYKKRDL